MPRTSISSVAVLVALLASTSQASASVPSPFNSFVSPCFVACPAGDIVFQVVVRDLSSNPVGGSHVVLEFCECPSVHLCSPDPSDPYTRLDACRILRTADANGVAVFPVRAGGVCDSVGVRVLADGVLLAVRFAASPDQDGDLAVTAADDAILVTKSGTSDPTGDLDCSGLVGPPDRSILFAHYGHNCVRPTSLSQPSWGGVKIRYR